MYSKYVFYTLLGYHLKNFNTKSTLILKIESIKLSQIYESARFARLRISKKGHCLKWFCSMWSRLLSIITLWRLIKQNLKMSMGPGYIS